MNEPKSEHVLTKATKPRQKTDESLNLLARDILAGDVFTSDQVVEDKWEKLPEIFFPLKTLEFNVALLEKEDEEITFLYEYTEKSMSPKSSDYPIFRTMQTLNMADHQALLEIIKKRKKLLSSTNENQMPEMDKTKVCYIGANPSEEPCVRAIDEEGVEIHLQVLQVKDQNRCTWKCIEVKEIPPLAKYILIEEC